MPVVARRRRATKPVEVERDDFLWGIESFLDSTLAIPDVIEFCLSDAYLGRTLYPLQATLLKIAFLQDELFTDYDYQVIDWWSKAFALTGDYGTQVDLLERIRINKAEGRKWFREWVCIIGRRGGKGYIGGLAASYVLWNYLSKGDPQSFYGVTFDKRLSMYVFAGKKEQAMSLQWKDVVNPIKSSTCFAPYLPERPLGESLVVYAPNDFIRIADREAMGQYPKMDDMATFEIVPKESTLISARGPATFALMFDEMAFVTKATAKADASEVYDAAVPALDQFKKDAWIYEGSSPWQMIGQFYENWVASQHVSDGEDGFDLGHITRPEMFMVQLPSWDPYTDWQKAEDIPIRPPLLAQDPLFYAPQNRAMQEYDAELKKLEVANPEKFNVERRSKWASVLDAYLNPERVDAIFEPFPANEYLPMRSAGSPLITYIAHGDPGAVNDAFAVIIAHKVNVKGSAMPHVIFDYVTHWVPQDFPDNQNQVDYEYAMREMSRLIKNFLPEEFSFDQGHSVWMVQQLRKWVAGARLIKPVNVFIRPATKQLNWAQAESFKAATYLGLVHSPPYVDLRAELMFIQKTGPDKVEAPTTGPVQHDDLAVTAFNIVHSLIGEHIASMIGDSMPGIQASTLGGLPHPPVTPNTNTEARSDVIDALRQSTKSQRAPYTPARGKQFVTPRRW